MLSSFVLLFQLSFLNLTPFRHPLLYADLFRMESVHLAVTSSSKISLRFLSTKLNTGMLPSLQAKASNTAVI